MNLSSVSASVNVNVWKARAKDLMINPDFLFFTYDVVQHCANALPKLLKRFHWKVMHIVIHFNGLQQVQNK